MTALDPRSARRRTVILIIALVMAMMLIVILLLLVRSGGQKPPRPVSSTTPTQQTAPALQATSPPPPTSLFLSSVSTPSPDDSTAEIARINGALISSATVTTMQLADAAVARLLGQSAAQQSEYMLDRLINGELVAQAARSAGFAPNPADVDSVLQSWLTSLGKSQADLDHALDAVGLDASVFRSYFAHLLTIDRFAAQAAQNANISVADYLRRLQSSAQVSLGPAAMNLAAAGGESGNSDAANTPPSHTNPMQADTIPAAPGSPTSSFGLQVLADQLGDMTPVTATANVNQNEARSPEPGNLAPLFDVALLNDNPTARLTLAELAGKPTVLSFWTTWCPYCRQQTPILTAAHDADAGRQFNWVGVNVQEGRESVAAYVVQHQIGYPIALDVGGEVAALYAVNGYPITYFLDAQTRIVARHLGALTEETLTNYLHLLAGL